MCYFRRSIRRRHLFWLVFFIALALTGLRLPPAAAASASDPPRIILNGQQLYFDVNPVIENGRTLVPVRTIFEAMGAELGWNEATRTVTAGKGAINIVMPIGSSAPKVNGKTTTLEVPPRIAADRTLAPLRFVGEAFGGRVSWEDNTRTIYINNGSVAKPPAVRINPNLVNIRSGPSTLTAVVDQARSGEVLSVLGEQDGWFQVSRRGRTGWLASWLVTATNQDPTPAPQIRTVVLDAGHGGSEPGASGNELREKDVNLKITLKVGELLKQKGIPVAYTRTGDQYVGLDNRSAIANNLNAGLFVSIHNNASSNISVSGTETYFYAPASNPNLYAQRSERQRLAASIQTSLVNQIQRKNLGVKEANFSVLRKTNMPSALVEVVFISNPAEEELLKNDDFINNVAAGIANGIIAYLNN